MTTSTLTMITTITACAAGTLGCASAQPMDDSHDTMNGHGTKYVHYIDGPREDAPIPRPGASTASPATRRKAAMTVSSDLGGVGDMAASFGLPTKTK